MTSETSNSADELRRMIAEELITEEALQAMTGIRAEALRRFLDETPSGPPGLTSAPQALSLDEIARVSVLAGQLSEGLRIDDDERLTAIVESLTIECRLSLRQVAQLTGLEIEDLESVVRDPRTVSFEKRYQLAIRSSYLINAVNLARER